MSMIISVARPIFAPSSRAVTLRAMPKTPAPRKAAKVAPSSVADGHEMTLELARLRYQLLTRIVDGGRVVAWIAAAAIPLMVIEKIARALAGKNTQFTATVSVTIAISVCISIGWAITALRSHERKREVDRLRGRNDLLERQLLTLRGPTEYPTVNSQREPMSEEATE
jgi:hypothetical protein